MDQFFDCLNVRSLTDWEHKRKELLRPYTTVNDIRFKWLRDEFLKFFENWLDSINLREGEYTVDQRSKIFLASQTYEGLKITVNSVIECVQFLLNSGVKDVLRERFCQDTLEEYFGC